MRRIINLRPSTGSAVVLAALPFLLLLAAYLVGSSVRLAANPEDKLLPAFSTIGAAIKQYAVDSDPRTGEVMLWADTAASLVRLIPYVRAGLSSFVAVLSLIPPLAVLPILFIVFGLGELSKVVLIVIGITPFMVRDLTLRVGEIPAEEIIKAQTLGASSWTLVLRVVLPQLLPRLDQVQLCQLG